ncbi:MAG: hypothetical protein WBA57_27665 [Elainellaceae cyanobacterium]
MLIESGDSIKKELIEEQLRRTARDQVNQEQNVKFLNSWRWANGDE